MWQEIPQTNIRNTTEAANHESSTGTLSFGACYVYSKYVGNAVATDA